MSTSKHLISILGTILAFQAYAYENLVGEYTGKLSSVEGYSGNVGDPCAVIIGTSDRYGGSLIFEIRKVEKLVMETRKVEQAIKPESDTVKIATPGRSGGEPAEIVVLKLNGDGTIQSLKLMVHGGVPRRDKSVICGDLSKN